MKYLSLLLLVFSFLSAAQTEMLTQNTGEFRFYIPKHGSHSDDGKYTLFYEAQNGTNNSFPYEQHTSWWLYDHHAGDVLPVGVITGEPIRQIANVFMSKNGKYISFLARSVDGGDLDMMYVYDIERDSYSLHNRNQNDELYDGRFASAQISDNGGYIAFSTVATNVDVNEQQSHTSVKVYRKSLSDNSVTLIHSDPSNSATTGTTERFMSFDGKKIAYLSVDYSLHHYGYKQLILWDEDSGKRVLSTHDGVAIPYYVDFFQLAYSGEYAAFVSRYNTETGQSGGTKYLYYASANTGRLTNLNVTSDGVIANNTIYTGHKQFDVNADGTLVAYISNRTNFDPQYANNAYHVYLYDAVNDKHYGVSYIEGRSDLNPRSMTSVSFNSVGDKLTISTAYRGYLLSEGAYRFKSGVHLRDVTKPELKCSNEVDLKIESDRWNRRSSIDLTCPNEVNLIMTPR